LNELAPNKFLFVGNKKIKIEKFIPDFIRIDEKKQIIESFGAYWHAMKNANDKKRIESYKKYGFKVLIVLEKESKNIEALKAKIQNFISS
jgi:very-short-patch-repair endonuclease